MNKTCSYKKPKAWFACVKSIKNMLLNFNINFNVHVNVYKDEKTRVP
jgi:hypothetical protein